MPANREPRLIAYYLPQFHPIPENDEWWGKGFTEWRNVTRARPLFNGHYQPHLPADLGFYDLRVPEVRDEQAALAKRYGIYGFCYYYYWFDGKRLLDRPLREVLESGKPDFPLCICWANENWTRRWDGYDQEVLIAQKHSPESDERFILDAIPILNDPRYIRVDDKPMLLVYRVDLLPRPVETAEAWRRVAAASGIPDLHLCAVQSAGTTDPRAFGFDAAVELPPHGMGGPEIEGDVRGVPLNFTGRVLDYRDEARWFLSKPVPDFPQHRGLMVSWDNSPRRGNRATILANATPAAYQDWLAALVRDSYTRPGASEFIFINAWNEWAEGAHLEPDLKFGHAYLEATRRALITAAPPQFRSVEQGDCRPAGPLVSVIVRSHNGTRFVHEAIASVDGQTHANIELIVIDDGSSDESVAAIERLLAEVHLRRITLKTQPMLGAAASIDRGVVSSNGEYVAILNWDHVFAPQRIETFVQHAGLGKDAFLFSGVSFYSTCENPILLSDGPDDRVRWYTDGLRLLAATPTTAFALLGARLPTTTSNFFFSRALFDKLGGFDSQLPLAHDWDFALRATQYVEPQFVADELVTCRYHGKVGAKSLSDRYLAEGRAALARYIDLTRHGVVNELAPTAQNWPEFFHIFSAAVTPWFATGPLVDQLPPGYGKHGIRGRRFASAHDAAAIKRFDVATAEPGPWTPRAPVSS
jgi:glycosyltransferase involved in cell wall biosynthesis